MMRQLAISLLLLGCLGCGSQQVYHDKAAFKEAFYAEGSGSIVAKPYGNLMWTCKLVPTELDAVENPVIQLEATGPAASLHFILHVGPTDPGSMGDVMVYGVEDEAAYSKRMIDLNFRIREAVVLHIGQSSLNPVIAHMENTYGLTEGREIHLIFADPALEGPWWQLPDLDLVLADEVFHTGISHFRYPSERLLQLPRLEI
jgi:hypothetical protein